MGNTDRFTYCVTNQRARINSYIMTKDGWEHFVYCDCKDILMYRLWGFDRKPAATLSDRYIYMGMPQATLRNSSPPWPPHAPSAPARPTSSRPPEPGSAPWVTEPSARPLPVCGMPSLTIWEHHRLWMLLNVLLRLTSSQRPFLSLFFKNFCFYSPIVSVALWDARHVKRTTNKMYYYYYYYYCSGLWLPWQYHHWWIWLILCLWSLLLVSLVKVWEIKMSEEFQTWKKGKEDRKHLLCRLKGRHVYVFGWCGWKCLLMW